MPPRSHSPTHYHSHALQTLPPPRHNNICIEVMRDANDWEELHEKRVLYREAGAEEVWIVDRDGQIHVFRDDEREHSDLVPEFPSSL